MPSSLNEVQVDAAIDKILSNIILSYSPILRLSAGDIPRDGINDIIFLKKVSYFFCEKTKWREINLEMIKLVFGVDYGMAFYFLNESGIFKAIPLILTLTLEAYKTNDLFLFTFERLFSADKESNNKINWASLINKLNGQKIRAIQEVVQLLQQDPLNVTGPRCLAGFDFWRADSN
jgi:hypothetical protein